jgi:hypothetical protein
MMQGVRGTELTSDRFFSRRVKRLVVVSAVALGVILALGVADEAPTWALALIATGWVVMPLLLWMSLRRPRRRYLLVIPATCVSLGLLAITASSPAATRTGWLLITAGILIGGTMGMWFWFRWAPVPRILDDPFGWGRMTLVAVHIALILAGISLVVSNL